VVYDLITGHCPPWRQARRGCADTGPGLSRSCRRLWCGLRCWGQCQPKGGLGVLAVAAMCGDDGEDASPRGRDVRWI